MAETTCLCHTISLLSVLLISDIGLISGIAHALSTEPNDSRTIHEDGLLAYALLTLSLIALGLMIAILMLASLLIKTMKNILSPNIKPSRPSRTEISLAWNESDTQASFITLFRFLSQKKIKSHIYIIDSICIFQYILVSNSLQYAYDI